MKKILLSCCLAISMMGRAQQPSYCNPINVDYGYKCITLADKRNNHTDVPHDYVSLEQPVRARYIRLVNKHVPTGRFAISGLRVFGKGGGSKPAAVEHLTVLRTEKDKRSAWVKWKPAADAYAYNIYYGTAPDKLYTNIMVYNANEYWLKTMDKEKVYYFTIEAINESGVSERVAVQRVE